MEEFIYNLIMGLIALFVISICVLLFVLLFVNTSFTLNEEGYHTGYVTAVQKEGMFVKHYRVYFKTDKQSSQEDEYCIPVRNQELFGQLKETQTSDNKITLNYSEKFTTGMFNSECGDWEITGFDTNE